MSKCFVWGTDKLKALEDEFHSLINRQYSFGENATPFTINGKTIYCYHFNPDADVNLPGDGLAVIATGVDTIINHSIQVLSLFGDADTNNRWTIIPAIKKGDANTMLGIEITQNNRLGLHNRTITGNKKIKGFIYYTKLNDE